MSSSLGNPEIACEASMPDITADSTQPSVKPQAVQSPATVMFAMPDASGEMRYWIDPGFASTYWSDGLMFADTYIDVPSQGRTSAGGPPARRFQLNEPASPTSRHRLT